jgi:hypothetical protein
MNACGNAFHGHMHTVANKRPSDHKGSARVELGQAAPLGCPLTPFAKKIEVLSPDFVCPLKTIFFRPSCDFLDLWGHEFRYKHSQRVICHFNRFLSNSGENGGVVFPGKNGRCFKETMLAQFGLFIQQTCDYRST